MDRITRKQLKRDAFVREVGHTFGYLSEHRKWFISLVVAVVVIASAAAGYRYHSGRQHDIRQKELHSAMRVLDAGVGPANDRPTVLTFPTVEERNRAAASAFAELAENHPGTPEATIAKYFQGTIAVDEGRLDDAQKFLKEAADSPHREYASLARLTMAQIYHRQGNTGEAEKILRSLIERPTILVSKERATIALAEVLAQSRPREARNLLEPLRTEPGAVSRAALNLLGELPLSAE